MFDAHEHRRTLAQNDNYLGKQDFSASTLEWRSAKKGHTVFDKEDEESFQAVMIGKVGNYRYNVGPTGNYINSQYGLLAKAKYQFHLTCPVTSPFHEDYNRSFQILKRLQDIAAVTSKRSDMLFEDSGGRTIRMTRNIFEKRRVTARDSPSPAKKIKLEGETESEEVEEMDEETKNWNVPAEHQDELDAMKANYRAVPLPVYKDNQFIEPGDVMDRLSNALIEVTFTINHTYIKRAPDAHDSFQAEIEQIVILKTASWQFQTHNPRTGPSQLRKRQRKDGKEQSATQKRKEASRPATSEAGPSGS